jgi:hypothetical protein
MFFVLWARFALRGGLLYPETSCHLTLSVISVNEKLIIVSLIKKLSAFYQSQSFIIVLTKAHTEPYYILIQLNLVHIFIFYFRFILILSSHLHLGLPNAFFPSVFPTEAL